MNWKDCPPGLIYEMAGANNAGQIASWNIAEHNNGTAYLQSEVQLQQHHSLQLQH